MTFRVWISEKNGANYQLYLADSEEAAMRRVPRWQRAFVTKVERVRTSTEWRAEG